MDDLLVKIAAPIGRDAELLAGFLRDSGVQAQIITDTLGELRAENRDAAGALLIAEEALTPKVTQHLGALLSGQPKWSDLPFLLMVSGGRDAPVDQQRQRDRIPLGSVTILDRPLRPSSLLSAVQTALRARSRQFEVRDMTHNLETANAEIRMSEQRSRLILESTHDCIKLLDLEGNLLTMNEEGQKRLGISDFEDVCGTSWLGFCKADGDEHAVKAMKTALAGGMGSFEGFYETPAGEATWWDVSVTPVRDDTGKIVNLLAVSREVTSRKLTEKALIQNEKLAAVGRLASTISHEINNPLEAVTNLIYIALHTDGLPASAHETLSVADDELRRASQIVGQTLKFYRQTTGPRETTPEELSSSVLTLYRGRLENYQIKMEARHRSGVSVVCFEGEIRQVLSNLVGNAIDAMRLGGRLLVRSYYATDFRNDRRGVVITIADTGHGMNTEIARRIFEAFYSTKGDNGTGLGLWITKGIIEKHNGTLSVRTKDGSRSGTVFRVFLPVAA